MSIAFMQKWFPLLKVSDRDKAQELVERLKSWVMSFAPTTTSITDIDVI